MSWTEFANSTVADATEVNENFDYVDGTVKPHSGTNFSDLEHDLGSYTNRWNDVYCGGIDAGGTGTALKTKMLDIGDWNMNSFATATVAHGLTFTDMRDVRVTIRNDANSIYYPLDYNDDLGQPNAGGFYWRSSTVVLERYGGGTFDNNNFSATSYNRGWVLITHI